MPNDILDTVAAASAECGMHLIANFVPADRHDELRELLYDLLVTALIAYRDAELNWFEVPQPSAN